jgi:hypothetical protein
MRPKISKYDTNTKQKWKYIIAQRESSTIGSREEHIYKK